MSEITIRPAREDDREWCAQLMASSEPWITLGRQLDSCRKVFARPGYELFLACSSADPLGFVLCHRYGAMSSPYITTIAVDHATRGKGVGHRLLEFVEEHYRGRRHLFLCVSSFNPRARQLYEAVGYRVVADLEGYVIPGASEILMHKRLE
jgi:ribosomal protein S18 acetylase RimI-like enzyme